MRTSQPACSETGDIAMPGGIGPVSQQVASAGKRGDRGLDGVSDSNAIFYHLDGRHVFYDRGTGYLYFVEASQGLITRTLRATLTGMRAVATIEQLHLDVHRLFMGASRIALSHAQADCVLTALRLVGVGATIR